MTDQQGSHQYRGPEQASRGRFYSSSGQPVQGQEQYYASKAPSQGGQRSTTQPPYYIAQPQQPPRGPLAGESGKAKPRIPLPVLMGLVLALVIAGAAYALTGGGSPSPSGGAGSSMTASGQLKTLWAAGGTAGDTIQNFSGSWATSDVVIDARVDGAIAYRLSNGAQAWGWQAPSDTQTCSMSTGTSEGIGVIAYGGLTGKSVENCDHLVGLDLETGMVLWTINLDPNQTTGLSVIKVGKPYVSISGDTLATQGENQTLTVFSLKTGKLRWQTASTVGSIEAAVCDPEGVQVVDQTVYELQSCLSTAASGGQSVQLEAYDATASTAPSPRQMSGIGSIPANTVPELWQAGNYLLVVGFSLTRASEIIAYDAAAGTGVPATIALGTYSQDAFESSTDGQLNPRAWAVYGDEMYIEDQGDGKTVNGVAAVSLKTGKTLWDQTPGGNTASTIVSAGPHGVEVVMSVPQQSGYRLATLAQSNGAATYGPGTSDNRFFIDGSNSSVYIQGTYFVNIEDMTVGSTPGIVVLSGVTG